MERLLRALTRSWELSLAVSGELKTWGGGDYTHPLLLT